MELSPAGRIKRGGGEAPIPCPAAAATDERRKPKLCCLRIQPRPVAIETGLRETSFGSRQGRKCTSLLVAGIPSPKFLSTPGRALPGRRWLSRLAFGPVDKGRGEQAKWETSTRDFLS